MTEWSAQGNENEGKRRKLHLTSENSFFLNYISLFKGLRMGLSTFKHQCQLLQDINIQFIISLIIKSQNYHFQIPSE